MDPFKYHLQNSEDPIKPFEMSSESESKENIDASQINFDGKGVMFSGYQKKSPKPNRNEPAVTFGKGMRKPPVEENSEGS
jgi:hypothetical protein